MKAAISKRPTGTALAKNLTDKQRDYESKRAAKAGMSLEKWLASKQKQQAAEAKEKAAVPAKPAKPGLFKRLLDRAHQPLKPKSR